MAAARRNNKGRGGKGSDRRLELSLGERFQEVRDFWLKQPPARRRQLLRVPIRRLLQGVSLACTLFLVPMTFFLLSASPSLATSQVQETGAYRAGRIPHRAAAAASLALGERL